MSTTKRPIHFTAPSNIQVTLIALKQERYSGVTIDDMLADLIRMGLAAAASQNKANNAAQNSQS